MKVLMLLGSPHSAGAGRLALDEMAKIFEAEGIESEIVQVGGKTFAGCRACGACRKAGKCVIDDSLDEITSKFEAADGLVVESPVYYAGMNGTVKSVLDRIFHSSGFDKRMKVGAGVTTARRGGTTATFDELNKYFTIAGMPVASGQYWNGLHGNSAEEAAEDIEGLQQMRTLARNMSFLIKSISLGKEKYGLPEKEPLTYTNFIH